MSNISLNVFQMQSARMRGVTAAVRGGQLGHVRVARRWGALRAPAAAGGGVRALQLQRQRDQAVPGLGL